MQRPSAANRAAGARADVHLEDSCFAAVFGCPSRARRRPARAVAVLVTDLGAELEQELRAPALRVYAGPPRRPRAAGEGPSGRGAWAVSISLGRLGAADGVLRSVSPRSWSRMICLGRGSRHSSSAAPNCTVAFRAPSRRAARMRPNQPRTASTSSRQIASIRQASTSRGQLASRSFGPGLAAHRRAWRPPARWVSGDAFSSTIAARSPPRMAEQILRLVLELIEVGTDGEMTI